MADVGYVALFLALIASLYSGIIYILGARKKHQVLVQSARIGILAACGLVTVSVIILLVALLSHNYQIEYVASYTSNDSSLVYLITALWAGNNGSLLFWAWILSIFAAIAILCRREANQELVPYTAIIVMVIQAFFILLLLSVANPFQELSFVPADGRGLNPLLENPGMIIHPPALLVGYVGFSIPFAFAIAALLTGKLGNEWLTAIRRWTLLAWLLLGIGNIIGAWWAYIELGWGGYWAWDPVENAGLMPWLIATAFLHSVVMQRRRGMFKVWNMVLIVLAFNLAIFGTFLTRSGILSSVHTFGETGLEPFFIIFLCITFFGSLGLLLYRKDELKDEADIESFVSKEFTFYLNNILFVGATLVILIGTLFPAITEAIRSVKIEVGESFFNTVNAPIFLVIILLIGICTFIGWRRATLKNLISKLLWPFVITVVLTIVIIILGVNNWYTLIGAFLCTLVFFTVLYNWVHEIRMRYKSKEKNYLKAFWGLFQGNKARYGGYIVHIAIAIIAIGIIGSSTYEVEKEVSLRLGESVTIENYTLEYNRLDAEETPSKTVVTALLSVYDGEKLITEVRPEKYFHRSYEQPVSEVAIHTTPLEDLYVILAGWDEDRTATFKILVNPLVIWIWIGGGIFLLGGLLAFWAGPKQPSVALPETETNGQVTTSAEDNEVSEEIEKQIKKLRQTKGRYCSKCGASYQKEDRYCSHCGTVLSQNENDN